MERFGRIVGVLIAAVVGACTITLWFTVGRGGVSNVGFVTLALLTVGVQTTLWGTMGLLRWLDEATAPRRARRRAAIRVRGSAALTATVPKQRLRTRVPVGVGADMMPRLGSGAVSLDDPETLSQPLTRPGGGVFDRPLTRADVAALIPAHNEEAVLEEAIESVAQLLPRRQIYVVSDASKDGTVEIARNCGVNVLDLNPNRGKAGALEEALYHFQICERYEALMIVDADIRLHPEYLTGALPVLADPEVVAVAGYVQPMWRDWMNVETKFIHAYRDRLYTLMQMMFKWGQTWRRVNVVHIVPGACSVYRTSVLPHMEMNPPGLVIEDFNMTFQVHRRGLGRIAFTPRVSVDNLEPIRLRDYRKQVRRWNLGFWQTVRYNGVWPSRFWLSLALNLTESLLAATAILASVVMAAVLLLPPVTDGAIFAVPWFGVLHDAVGRYISLPLLFMAVFLPDFFLTCIVAAIRRRPVYLLYGLGFTYFRVVDAFLAWRCIPLAWTAKSNGQWTPPARR